MNLKRNKTTAIVNLDRSYESIATTSHATGESDIKNKKDESYSDMQKKSRGGWESKSQ